MADKNKKIYFKSDKLTIFNCEGQVNETNLRTYMIQNWKTITKNLDNSTILFLAGVHGGKDGTLGEKEPIKYLKNQVILQFPFNYIFTIGY